MNLIARLRANDNSAPNEAVGWDRDVMILCGEAAEAMTRLQAENAALRGLLHNALDTLDAADIGDDLQAEICKVLYATGHQPHQAGSV